LQKVAGFTKKKGRSAQNWLAPCPSSRLAKPPLESGGVAGYLVNALGTALRRFQSGDGMICGFYCCLLLSAGFVWTLLQIGPHCLERTDRLINARTTQ
jgi:hypothetical protein